MLHNRWLLRMYLITYDIVKDKNRVKVAKILLDYGVRVQYSVFESDMTESELKMVIQIITERIDPETDSVRVYNMCAGCEQKIINIGVEKSYSTPDVIAV